jgi:hypothetical protein
MKTDTILKVEGMNILGKYLGPVDAERFVALMSREPFDYTDWRQNIDEGTNIRELSKKAMDYQKTLE